MAVLRHYAAMSPAEFDRIADWVYDSDSATGQLALDAERRELRIEFASYPPHDEEDDFPKAELLETTLLGRYFKQPYVRCSLTVRAVIGTEPDLAALDEPVSFSHPEVGDDGRSIHFASDTESAFTVFVSALDVELQVTDEIAHYRKHGYGRGVVSWESRGGVLD